MGTKHRENRREATQKEIEWMQLQRACRISISEIMKNTGFAESTVYKHVKDTPQLPTSSLSNSATLVLSLINRAIIDAHKAWDDGEDLSVHKELGLQINRHADTITRLLEAADVTDARAAIEALAENIARLSEAGETKAAALLQKVYDERISAL